jgi:hypothetical protein
MKKFKLIKEYEGGPQLGTEVNKCNDFPNYNFNGGNYTTAITAYFVENSPEFWEEVKENFPKIISFRSQGQIYNFPNGYNKLTNNKLFTNSVFCEIYRIAVSETEVFTLGDKCHLSNGNGNRNPILKFEVRNDSWGLEKYRNKNRIVVYLETMHKTAWGPLEIDILVKSPEPLFVTEDKKEIYPGDSYWCVNTASHLWSLFEQTAKDRTQLNRTVLAFSIKEAAEKYIDENKPIYSKKQIKEALFKNSPNHVHGTYIYLHVPKFEQELNL